MLVEMANARVWDRALGLNSSAASNPTLFSLCVRRAMFRWPARAALNGRSRLSG